MPICSNELSCWAWKKLHWTATFPGTRRRNIYLFSLTKDNVFLLVECSLSRQPSFIHETYVVNVVDQQHAHAQKHLFGHGLASTLNKFVITPRSGYITLIITSPSGLRPSGCDNKYLKIILKDSWSTRNIVSSYDGFSNRICSIRRGRTPVGALTPTVPDLESAGPPMHPSVN